MGNRYERRKFSLRHTVSTEMKRRELDPTGQASV